MNRDAGRGNLVIVTVGLNNDRKLPFVIDTGAPVTILDKSLESYLGRPKGTATQHHFGVISTNLVFKMPKLYLGDTPLWSDTNGIITTCEIKQLLPGEPLAVLGVLGMDILSHYCIQLDFQASQVRWLKATSQNEKEWGRPYPLQIAWGRCPAIDENLAGIKGSPSLVDTGFNGDGLLIPELFNQWTNQTFKAANGGVRSPVGLLGGEYYRDLDLNETLRTDINIIGIHILSQNLITFDFPNKVMYLKRVSEWPLAEPNANTKAKFVADSAFNYLIELKSLNRLPGFSKTDKGNLVADFYEPDVDHETMRFRAAKNDEPFIYYYSLTRKNGVTVWQLAKAWETGPNGNVITNFCLPDGHKTGLTIDEMPSGKRERHEEQP